MDKNEKPKATGVIDSRYHILFLFLTFYSLTLTIIMHQHFHLLSSIVVAQLTNQCVKLQSQVAAGPFVEFSELVYWIGPLLSL
jgi:hypothetical protein